MAAVTLKDITKVYPGDVKAVDDFNLEINDREFVILVGPSGCGKSTTLRMIAGLEEITGGELYIGDRLVNNLHPKDRDIAMVFQNYALYPHMSVYDNMAFGLKMRKMPKADIRARVEAVAEQLELTELLQRKPSALSGGQRQRVALGRAMVREPAVFLLDEPLSNLDAKLRASMRTEIMRLHRRMGVTFVYVTHDQTEAMTMADRIVVMKDGLIQQVAAPQDLYRSPVNLFVAGFIGSPSINTLTVTPRRRGGRWQIAGDGFELAIADAIGDRIAAYEDRAMILGLRPEDLGVSREPVPGALPAEVEVVEMLGSESYLHLMVGHDLALTVRVQRSDISSGEQLFLAVPDQAIHLFDAETQATVVCRVGGA